MALSKLATECEKCPFVKWCPNKRKEAMMALPLPSRTIDELALERIDKASLDGLIENLREELAKIYGVPRCFFEETR